jgi:hypothetical protein
MLACGLLLPRVDTLNLRLDSGLVRALLYIELALPVLLFVPAAQRGRAQALQALSLAAACWVACTAVIATFTFAGGRDPFLHSRPSSAMSWLLVCGLISWGAQFSATWRERMRLGALVLVALPPLWHYFGLEYSGISLLALREYTPVWALSGSGLSWLAGGVGCAAFAGALLTARPPRAEAA